MPASRKEVGGVLYSSLMFLVVSALCGVLIAGLAVPLTGLVSMGSKSTLDSLEELPVELDIQPQAQRTKVLLGDGTLLTNLYDENRVYVTLDKISPIMQTAQVAIEDHRFYEHGAMDLKSTLSALLKNSSGGETAGASSITQQYVKMVQVETAALNNDQEGVRKAQEQTYTRKIQELRYAIALEQKLSKDQILERYLNIAYYGNGAYGVEAAAHFYFNTTAAKLNLEQSAMLAGLVQNPDQINPVRAERAATERRNVILNRMAQLGLISTAEATKAKEVQFDESKIQRIKRGCEVSAYPFLCQYVENSLLQLPSLGATVEERRALIYRGGLTIKTQIDPKTQQAAQSAISNMVAPTDQVIATMNIVQPGTGLILAMAQSRPVMGADKAKGETYYNYNVTPALGGAEGYQAGSTFKAFALAAALENGVKLDQVYPAPQTKDFSQVSWDSCNGRFKLTGQWKVSNSTGSAARMNLATATARSVNTYYVQLEHRAGLCNTVRAAERAGIDLTTPGQTFEDLSYIPSFVLGAIEVAPLSVAEAYATFAARGVHCDPHIVESVTSASGKAFDVPDGNCQQVMRPEVADGVTKMLQGVMEATGSRAVIGSSYPQAGKTGTTEEGQAVWFAGYTPEIAGAAMIAADKTAPLFKKNANGRAQRSGIRGMTLKTGAYLEGSGGGDPGARIYKPAMTAAIQGKPRTPFVAPPAIITPAKQVTIPSLPNQSPQQIFNSLSELGFAVGRANIYDSAPRGTYLYFSPGPNRVVDQGANITMYYSLGPKPAPPPATTTPATPPSSQPPAAPPPATGQPTIRATQPGRGPR